MSIFVDFFILPIIQLEDADNIHLISAERLCVFRYSGAPLIPAPLGHGKLVVLTGVFV